MRSMFKILGVPVFGLMVLLGSSALVGCNTTEGAGKDMQSAGDSISETARDVKD